MIGGKNIILRTPKDNSSTTNNTHIKAEDQPLGRSIDAIDASTTIIDPTIGLGVRSMAGTILVVEVGTGARVVVATREIGKTIIGRGMIGLMAVIGKVEVVITQIEDTIDIEKAQGCVLGKMREKREVKKKIKKKKKCRIEDSIVRICKLRWGRNT